MKRKQDFLLGLVVLVMIAGFLGTLMFIYPRFGAATKPIVVQFEHRSGVTPLKPGSVVLLSGAIQVGSVTSVETIVAPSHDPARQGRDDLIIEVKAEVRQDVPLYADCQITSDQPAVGGAGYLVILDIGDPAAGEVSTAIAGLPPQSLAAAIGNLSRRLLGPGGMVENLEQLVDPELEGSLTNKLQVSLGDVNLITSRLAAELEPDQRRALLAKLHLVMDDVNAATTAIRTQLDSEEGASAVTKAHLMLDQLQVGLADAVAMITAARPRVDSTLAHVDNLSKRLDEEISAPLAAEFQRDDPEAMLAKIHAGIEDLNRSLANVAEASDAARSVVTLNRPALQRTIENIRDTSDQLRVGVQEVVLHPWRLFAPPQGEQQRIEAFQAARQFAEAAARLDDAAARLEAVSAAGGGDRVVIGAAELEEIQAALRLAFSRFQSAETYLWEQMRK